MVGELVGSGVAYWSARSLVLSLIYLYSSSSTISYYHGEDNNGLRTAVAPALEIGNSTGLPLPPQTAQNHLPGCSSSAKLCTSP